MSIDISPMNMNRHSIQEKRKDNIKMLNLIKKE